MYIFACFVLKFAILTVKTRSNQRLKVCSRSLLRATCRVVFFIRSPPQYALEVVHSSVRFRYKRPAKRVKNISPENNTYIYLSTLELFTRTKGTK